MTILNLPTTELRVMLVEGNRPLREHLAEAVHAARVDVLLSENVAEAIARTRTRPPDLAISNLALTDASGWLMFAKLRFLGVRRAWLYAPAASNRDRLWAEYGGVERLFIYGDIWSRLTSAVVEQIMQDRRRRAS